MQVESQVQAAATECEPNILDSVIAETEEAGKTCPNCGKQQELRDKIEEQAREIAYLQRQLESLKRDQARPDHWRASQSVPYGDRSSIWVQAEMMSLLHPDTVGALN